MKRNRKMHNVAVGLIAGIIVMLSAAACGETEVDPDLFGSSKLSEIIRDDFYGRYSGGVTVTDVLTYDDGKTYVWFTDTDCLAARFTKARPGYSPKKSTTRRISPTHLSSTSKEKTVRTTALRWRPAD